MHVAADFSKLFKDSPQMFSLIITIISIALVAALALATLYYGGDAFNQGRAGAEASKLINEGQQLNAAVQLSKATNTGATDLDGLVSDILTQLPQSFSGSGSTAIAGPATVVSTAEVCEEVQKRAGVADGVSPPAIPAGQMYGCTTDGSASTFYFKL
jgi:hypothetical protein